MLTAFKNHIDTHFKALKNQAFLIACSGGVDSVVLAHLCAALGLDFALAHCNFNLRGAASAADAQWVSALSKSLGVPFYDTSFDTKQYLSTTKVSVQMAARTLRYEWFDQLIKETRYNFLLTAHHKEDSIETMVINLSRGTGIDGLTGIPKKRDYIMRPLLPFYKSTLKNYAVQNEIDWREDSSNETKVYLRNKIRHEVLPLLASLHPNGLDNMAQTQSNLEDSATLAALHLDHLKNHLWEVHQDAVSIRIDLLLATPAVKSVVYGLFSPYGFRNSQAIIDLCAGETAKKLHSDRYVLFKDRSVLRLLPLTEETPVEKRYFIQRNLSKLNHPFALEISPAQRALNASQKDQIYVNEQLLTFPLVLRHPRAGDEFYPSGMRGKKKISKFLRDEKINVISKAAIWLLTNADDQIIWVVGLRSDRRFLPQSNSDKLLCFKVL